MLSILDCLVNSRSLGDHARDHIITDLSLNVVRYLHKYVWAQSPQSFLQLQPLSHPVDVRLTGI